MKKASHYLFTSESVSRGHPDKIADQISDAVLDECLRQDSFSRVACETLVTNGLVILAGEVSTTAKIDFQNIVRDTIKTIGYVDPDMGFDYRSCGIITALHEQSPDIARGISEKTNVFKQQGAGDQGIMFGYASDETKELMPLPIILAHKILKAVAKAGIEKRYPYLWPDAKSQVTIEYDSKHIPQRVHTVILSTQHQPDVSLAQLQSDMKILVTETCPTGMIDENTLFYINPTGRFVIGGPKGDSGLTGRKIMVDTYGGMGRHGGGAFSGKDASKVDRSAAYAARYVAKHLVAAKLAKRCEVQISYAIGMPRPISIRVETFGTSTLKEELLACAIPAVFDLTPKGIIDGLSLRRPIYHKTAFGGHFGREEPEFTWETMDKIPQLLEAIKQKHFEIL